MDNLVEIIADPPAIWLHTLCECLRGDERVSSRGGCITCAWPRQNSALGDASLRPTARRDLNTYNANFIPVCALDPKSKNIAAV